MTDDLFLAAFRRACRRYLDRHEHHEDVSHVWDMLASSYRPQEPAQ